LELVDTLQMARLPNFGVVAEARIGHARARRKGANLLRGFSFRRGRE
jgi:hypothetical protein